ncbi:MAG: Eco57I restriction-modification methylase domain-containing protein [Candidatus Nomurabacteria bacterium]|nr:MAG: Eco57I restriction-modification methylase domain-containing protein [Candidatus Nomurabacteria bacterium]
MQNNTFEKIDAALSKLSSERTIEAGLGVAREVLMLADVNGVKTDDPSSSDYVLLTALKLPNAERYDHWFQAHPKFKSNRACFALNDTKEGPLEAKLYALKKKSKLYVSGAVHFTPNYEDALFTRQDPASKIGVDFFLTPENDALLIVLSNNKSLRIVELKDQLSNTQKDIFSKWEGVANLGREALHLTIWDSFKLKSINEAFYKGIANSFKHLVSHLEEGGKSSDEARHFANRLHGRLLFCWFLDKKGFISRDVNYFDTTHTDASSYYKEKLELLFFGVLNTPQNDRERPHPDLKTPYLNGGLFEDRPDDWRGSDIPFPKGFFVNLYEHFSEFNFTTDESTPDYEQIAIDPEMLGRIFENLLAEINEETGEQARKAKGAFYTPREIVAYMCRESVRAYLCTALEAGDKAKNSIDRLLDTPDSDWAKSGTNSKRDVVEPVLREKIVKALDGMKVLDPACGSGAFPIGMLHLLVQIYERLDARFDPYRTKLGIMERNIYGVDIEPLAIEIARLRSFLALVVDQEYVEKKPNGGVDTLPNLEFKFVCANTLLPLSEEAALDDGGKYETLLEIKKEYFKATPKQREKLETKYSTLRKQGTMFGSQLNDQLHTYDPFSNEHPASFYDQLLMHDVEAKFDVVIGNPPYVSIWKIKPEQKDKYQNIYTTAKGHYDLYVLFYERAFGLLAVNGIISYITSNKWLAQSYGKQLRALLLGKRILRLLDFSAHQVFDSATVDTQISIISNADDDAEGGGEFEAYVHKTKKLPNLYSLPFSTVSKEVFKIHPDYNFKLDLDDGKVQIIQKIIKSTIKFENAFYVSKGAEIHNTKLKIGKGDFIHDVYADGYKQYLEGKNFERYVVKKKLYLDYQPSKHKAPCFPELFESHKIVVKNVVGRTGIQAVYDDVGYYNNDALINAVPYHLLEHLTYSQVKGKLSQERIKLSQKYDMKAVTVILNSKLLSWFFSELLSNGLHFYPRHLRDMPLPSLDHDPVSIDKLKVCYEEIVKATTQNIPAEKYLNEADELVYKLYDLTPEEIATIENS